MFYRKFNLLFQEIILVGCGGTGSRVIAPLIQVIKQAQASLNPRLFVIDGDEFEFKNLARQNCIDRDLGRNKAIVMAERYGAAYDFPVIAHPHMVTNSDDSKLHYQLSSSAHDQGYSNLRSTRKLWILCVDSITARIAILSQVGPDDVIIDAGNEDTFGQVSIFDRVSLPHVMDDSNTILADVKPFSGEYELPFIPAPMQAYLKALVNPPKATGSCADLDQSLAINNLMAAGIINAVQNLAYNNKFYCRTNYFDLIQGNNSERMTVNWFNQEFNEEQLHSNKFIEAMSNGFAYKLLLRTGNLSSRRDYHNGLLEYITSDLQSKVTMIDPSILAAINAA